MEDFIYQPIFEQLAHSQLAMQCDYRKLSSDYISVTKFMDREVLAVDPKALTLLTKAAIQDVSFLFRTSHLSQLAAILDDPEASKNDRFVASELLKNAVIAAEREFPSCQDTGTAIVLAKKGEQVFTGVDDAEFISKGVYEAYRDSNFRYSQVAPLSMFEEVNTKTNLPAQIDIYSRSGNEYHFLFITKGGGSANKTYLYQKTASLLTPLALEAFFKEAVVSLGTAACPPYHVAFVIGGTSAEMNLKTVKLASCGELDSLPTSGNKLGRAYRDLEWEARCLRWANETGIGAQFGGKYFAHDVRVIRLPRHGASCPVGLGVSCSADRQIKGKVTIDGIFLEQLEENPSRFIPAFVPSSGARHISSYTQSGTCTSDTNEFVSIDLNKPIAEVCKTLSSLTVSSCVLLNGPMIVARDLAHSRFYQMLKKGEELPEYFKSFPVYYAGPAKTPPGYASGSFGPTTSQRMDPYVAEFQAKGASRVMLGKGNRSEGVTQACAKYCGFYLGSIGGPAARLGRDCIKKVELIDFEDLGMEAVWRIEVVNFPAFIIVDDKGNDFFRPKAELLASIGYKKN